MRSSSPSRPLDEGTTYRFRLTGRGRRSSAAHGRSRRRRPLYVVHTLPGRQEHGRAGRHRHRGHVRPGRRRRASKTTSASSRRCPGGSSCTGGPGPSFPTSRSGTSTAYRVTVTPGVGLDGLRPGPRGRRSRSASRPSPEPGPRELRLDFAGADGGRPAGPGSAVPAHRDRHSRRDANRHAARPDLPLCRIWTPRWPPRERLTGPNRGFASPARGSSDRAGSIASRRSTRRCSTPLDDTPSCRSRCGSTAAPTRRQSRAAPAQRSRSSRSATSLPMRVAGNPHRRLGQQPGGPDPGRRRDVSLADGRRPRRDQQRRRSPQFATPADLKPRSARTTTSCGARTRAYSYGREPRMGAAIVAALGSEVSWLEGGTTALLRRPREPLGALVAAPEHRSRGVPPDRHDQRLGQAFVAGRRTPAPVRSSCGSGPARAIGGRDLAIARIPVELPPRRVHRRASRSRTLPAPTTASTCSSPAGARHRRWISVDDIVKPPTGSRSRPTGTPTSTAIPSRSPSARRSSTARPCPSLELRVRTSRAAAGTTVTTDADGVARTTVGREVHATTQPSGFDGQGISRHAGSARGGRDPGVAPTSSSSRRKRG